MDRLTLSHIDEQLESSEVKALCFLSRDVVNIKRLEGINDAKRLFVTLEEQGLLKDYSYLRQLLQTIRRPDLLRLLETDSRRPEETNANPVLSEYRVVLYKIYADMTVKHFEDLKFFLSDKLGRNKIEACKTALDVFAEMEKIGFLSNTNLRELHEILQKIDQQLAAIIQPHVEGEVSMDFNSPNFAQSVIFFSILSDVIKGDKLKRFKRKKKRDENTPRPPENAHQSTKATDEVISESAVACLSSDDCRMEHCAGPCTEATVPKVLHDDLKLEYRQLSAENVSLRSENDKLRSQNEELKETSRNTHFFSSIKSKMKLWLGLSNKDITFIFNVTECNISKRLRSWLLVMSETLEPLKWPSKHAILKNMPKYFRPKYKRCRRIIDCKENFINKLTHFTSRAQTYSTYKSHNTVKSLVGMSPAGAITFLSPDWGGRDSDKQIIGFYYLERNDKIRADRGFTIRDTFATLKIPNLTKVKKKLSAQEVDTSRRSSNVRIPIERLIGRLKNFKIMTTISPVTQVDLLDDMVIRVERLTLYHIDEQLVSSEVKALIFLSRDVVNIKRLEGINDAKRLFVTLEEQGLLKDYSYLRQLLQTIRRPDLLRLLETDSRRPEETNANPVLSEYRVVLYKIYADMTVKHFEDLKFFLSDKLGRNKIEACKTALDVFAEMEKIGFLSNTNLRELHEILQKIDQQLAAIIQPHVEASETRTVGLHLSDEEENLAFVQV
ncbi:uncharacterized protein LOC117493799 [Trematomus bernacchii]|uniref:uncharacterized protein LOC117493799 n=1 Tax=Trematomus bernacchii TaxID=40690 RepID=UPI00146B6244|nr:uncharacterized protein LOC117493799 [Trematomus bernacchii]XP_034000274.1 uncharacterized protein LOC117493799 [Trematomus bernacchii]XP_034000275.1 uncharacterized protein LOC117493799 [Trematomus bernacchii]XP_034000276.1 uncharacterized protein LOC117493799 [Trematomus bernacchii]